MNKTLDKVYDPQKYEDYIYKKWEDSGFFNPDVCVKKGICSEKADTFTVVLPPPNVTANLHLGHVVMVAITDALMRYYRMNGKRVLWIPGTDHAAIATQNVVEKKIWTEQKKTRHELGRTAFLKLVNDFANQTKHNIINQLKKSGASLDWSREAFTLDEMRKKAVSRMFIDMYNEGVIYQGHRVVNWCPRCHTTLADDEVEYKKEIGKLYWLKYGPFILATSRPETKLGDTAVAVYPGDKRYKDMVGKKYMIPGVLGEFEIVVVADRAVDPEFGSGAIKVTPAHDFTDYGIGQRHNINMKQIINEDGKMMDNCGKYQGMSTKQAREEIVKDMEAQGLIDHIDDNYEHNLAVCYRCGSTIEPIPSKQWFVAVDKKIKRLGNKSMKERAIEVVKSNQIKFVPDRFTKRYLDWMENLHDWCISRQIWFGHQIPVWYKDDQIYVGIDAPQGDDWKQDKDVLDTWFSSGMWTFSTLGWPEKTTDLTTYHPTQLLETGYEIITLWVSRMIMMSLFAMDDIPFENVYLHGMVLDAQGKKMSKSKGNGIDPIEMFNKYGTDATRMSLIIGNTPGNDMRISEAKIAEFRNFANKLWNIARYIINNDTYRSSNNQEELTESDKWILRRLQIVHKEVSEKMERFEFSAAGEQLRDFTWNDFADWYIEMAKFEVNEKSNILNMILENILKLWHPFMPFVTEAIWQEMGKKSLVLGESWPSDLHSYLHKYKISSSTFKESTKNISLLQDLIIAIRNIRSEYKIKPNHKLDVIIYAGQYSDWLNKQKILLEKLKTGVEAEILTQGEKLSNAAYATVHGVEIYIPLQGVIDINTESMRLQKRATELKKLADNIEKQLNNQNFVHNAPKDIIENQMRKQDMYKTELHKIKNQIKHLK